MRELGAGFLALGEISDNKPLVLLWPRIPLVIKKATRCGGRNGAVIPPSPYCHLSVVSWGKGCQWGKRKLLVSLFISPMPRFRNSDFLLRTPILHRFSVSYTALKPHRYSLASFVPVGLSSPSNQQTLYSDTDLLINPLYKKERMIQ